MALDFRRGSPDRPRGHALAYFTTPDDRVFATYLIVPPITIDLMKYMPPMFASHMPAANAQDVTAIPLPPFPEEVPGGEGAVGRLAELRDDDLIHCGSIDPTQLERALMRVADVGQQYVSIYRDWVSRAPRPDEVQESASSLDVDEIMISLMGEHDRISELVKQIGQVRYGLESGDTVIADEAVSAMERIGRYLPEKYRVGELIAAARRPGEVGARLAQLHTERCYCLATEDYAEVARLESEIRQIGAQS